MTKIYVTPGDDLQGAIDWLEVQGGGIVRLGGGIYVGGPYYLRNSVALIGEKDDLPSFSNDDIVAAPRAGTYSATLAEPAIRGQTRVRVIGASGSGPLPGSWVRVGGSQTPGFYGTEIAIVDAVEGDVIHLRGELYQSHAAGAEVTELRPFENVAIESVMLGPTSTVVAQGPIRLHGLSAFDTEDTAVLLEAGAFDFEIDDFTVGGVNCAVLARSAMAGVISRVNSLGYGARWAGTGIPRGLITLQDACTLITVKNCLLQRACVGLRLQRQGEQNTFRDITIRDMDPYDAWVQGNAAGEVGQFIGVVETSSGALPYSGGQTHSVFENIKVLDCDFSRMPIATKAYGVIIHDDRGSRFHNIEVLNRGPAELAMRGINLHDCFGSFWQSVTVRGCEPNLTFENSCPGVVMDDVNLSNDRGSGQNSLSSIIYANWGAAAGTPIIRGLAAGNGGEIIQFADNFMTGGAPATDGAELHDVLLAGRRYGHARAAWNDTSVAFATGDLVEAFTRADGRLAVRTWDGAAPLGQLAIIVRGTGEYGSTGLGPMFVTLTGRSWARVSGAVAVGSKLYLIAGTRVAVTVEPPVSSGQPPFALLRLEPAGSSSSGEALVEVQ